jgi:hypothetical protein
MNIFCYRFQGLFCGEAEYEYRYPLEDYTYKCILFLQQESDIDELELATKECSKYGFLKITELKGNPLKVETMNLPAMQKFVSHYEEAIEEGSALAIYPNT